MNTIEQIRQPIRNEWTAYEQLYADTMQSNHSLLNEVLQHVSVRRGKQLRPLLVLLSAQMCHGITDRTLQAAVALEMLHTSSLIHDDVVDSSPTRRGIDAVQTRWSNKVAVLTGDYMLAKVIQLISEIRISKIVDIVARLGQSLAAGELLQMHADGSMWISEEQYYRMIELKTACLFEACMEVGAESSGTTMRQRTALREYGRLFGLCFQIKDDLLDYSDNEEIGKPTMSDIQDGKATLPLLISLARAPKDEASHIKMICEQLAAKPKGSDAYRAEQEIKGFVLRYQGELYAMQKMQELRKKAAETLNVFHDSKTKQSLLFLFDYAINRVR